MNSLYLVRGLVRFGPDLDLLRVGFTTITFLQWDEDMDGDLIITHFLLDLRRLLLDRLLLLDRFLDILLNIVSNCFLCFPEEHPSWFISWALVILFVTLIQLSIFNY